MKKERALSKELKRAYSLSILIGHPFTFKITSFTRPLTKKGCAFKVDDLIYYLLNYLAPS